jgi:TPR repeat protein
VRRYQLAAAKGSADAQAELAFCYSIGKGVPKDDSEALRFLRLAAEQGNERGLVELGYYYENGWGGLRKDDREAVRLFKLAADQGHPKGQLNLGRAYMIGLGGLPKDEAEAVRQYKLAAGQGYRGAQNVLAIIHSQGRAGLRRDDQEAARLYKILADEGDDWAQAQLGFCYEQGGCALEKNNQEALRLYKLSADQGNTWAQAAHARLARWQQEEEQRRQKDAAERERQREQERQREAAERDRRRRSLLKEVFCRNLIEASMVEQGFLFLDEEGHLPSPKRLSDMKAAGVQAGITAGVMIALVSLSVLTGAGGIAKLPLFGRGDQNIDAIAHELAKYKSVSDFVGIRLKTGSVVLRLVINADDLSTQTIIHRLALIHNQSVTLRNYVDSFGRRDHIGSLSQGILLFSAHSRAKEFSSSFAATCLWHDPHSHKSQPWVVDLEDQTVTTSAGLFQWKRWVPLDSKGMLERLFQAPRSKV